MQQIDIEDNYWTDGEKEKFLVTYKDWCTYQLTQSGYHFLSRTLLGTETDLKFEETYW